METLTNIYKKAYNPIPCYSTTEVPINPKGFLANERTFLSWLHFSTILAGISLGILNFSPELNFISKYIFNKLAMTTSLIIIFASIFIMFYSFYKFRFRANRLRNRKSDYYGNLLLFILDDLFGPSMLIYIIFLSISMNFILNLISKLI